MFTQTIAFALPDGSTQDTVFAAYREAAHASRGQPGLLLRIFDYDEVSREGCVTSVWSVPDQAMTESADSWFHALRACYGEPVRVRTSKTLLVVDTSVDELLRKAMQRASG